MVVSAPSPRSCRTLCSVFISFWADLCGVICKCNKMVVLVLCVNMRVKQRTETATLWCTCAQNFYLRDLWFIDHVLIASSSVCMSNRLLEECETGAAETLKLRLLHRLRQLCPTADPVPQEDLWLSVCKWDCPPWLTLPWVTGGLHGLAHPVLTTTPASPLAATCLLIVRSYYHSQLYSVQNGEGFEAPKRYRPLLPLSFDA